MVSNIFYFPFYIWDNPSHWWTPSFFKMVSQPPKHILVHWTGPQGEGARCDIFFSPPVQRRSMLDVQLASVCRSTCWPHRLMCFLETHIFFRPLEPCFFLKINDFNFLDPPNHRPKPAHQCHISTCWPYKTVSEHQDHKDCYRSSAPGGQATWKIITLRKWVIRLSFF